MGQQLAGMMGGGETPPGQTGQLGGGDPGMGMLKGLMGMIFSGLKPGAAQPPKMMEPDQRRTLFGQGGPM